MTDPTRALSFRRFRRRLWARPDRSGLTDIFLTPLYARSGRSMIAPRAQTPRRFWKRLAFRSPTRLEPAKQTTAQTDLAGPAWCTGSLSRPDTAAKKFTADPEPNASRALDQVRKEQRDEYHDQQQANEEEGRRSALRW